MLYIVLYIIQQFIGAQLNLDIKTCKSCVLVSLKLVIKPLSPRGAAAADVFKHLLVTQPLDHMSFTHELHSELHAECSLHSELHGLKPQCMIEVCVYIVHWLHSGV